MSIRRPHAAKLRLGRYSNPGLHYFLTTSVANRRRIFVDVERAFMVIDALRWLHDAGKFCVDAAVVMPDHLHFAGQLSNSRLDKVMHTLKIYSANQLGISGIDSPIWQQGYYDHAIRNDEDYQVKLRYLIENPVRANLVERPEDYSFIILPKGWART